MSQDDENTEDRTLKNEEVLEDTNSEESLDDDNWDDDEGFGAEIDEDETDAKDEKDDESLASDEESDEDQSEDDPIEQNEESKEEESEERDESGEDKQSTETSEEQQKRYNDEMARRRIAERQLKEEREAKEEENLKRYLQEAEGNESEFSKRQAEVRHHLLNKEQSKLAQEKIDFQMNRAVAEFGLEKADDSVKEYMVKQLDKFDALYVRRDQAGNILDVKGDVYQYLKDEMDSIKAFQNIGAREQTKKKSSVKARTISKPTRAPKEPPKDEGYDAFDEEAGRW